MSPEADLESCRQFIRALSAAGVLRVQVHARKGLLDYGAPSPSISLDHGAARCSGAGAISSGAPGAPQLTQGGAPNQGTTLGGAGYSYSSATVANRHVPPLRHDVVLTLTLALTLTPLTLTLTLTLTLRCSRSPRSFLTWSSW